MTVLWTALTGLAFAQVAPPSEDAEPAPMTVVEPTNAPDPEEEDVVFVTDQDDALTEPTPDVPDHRVLTLGIDMGHQYTGQPDYALFPGNDLMLSLGARVQVAVVDRLQIVGTWQHGQRGAQVESFGADDPDDFVAALFVDQFALGPRLDVSIYDYAYPYVSAQAMLWRGAVRLDDDRSTTANPNQLRNAGLGFGGLVVGGLEIRIPDRWLSLYAEFGHRWVMRTTLGDLGTLRPRGYVQRLGIAVRL